MNTFAFLPAFFIIWAQKQAPASFRTTDHLSVRLQHFLHSVCSCWSLPLLFCLQNTQMHVLCSQPWGIFGWRQSNIMVQSHVPPEIHTGTKTPWKECSKMVHTKRWGPIALEPCLWELGDISWLREPKHRLSVIEHIHKDFFLRVFSAVPVFQSFSCLLFMQSIPTVDRSQQCPHSFTVCSTGKFLPSLTGHCLCRELLWWKAIYKQHYLKEIRANKLLTAAMKEPFTKIQRKLQERHIKGWACLCRNGTLYFTKTAEKQRWQAKYFPGIFSSSKAGGTLWFQISRTQVDFCQLILEW